MSQRELKNVLAIVANAGRASGNSWSRRAVATPTRWGSGDRELAVQASCPGNTVMTKHEHRNTLTFQRRRRIGSAASDPGAAIESHDARS